MAPGNLHHRCPLILILVTSPLLCHSELHPPPLPALAKTHAGNDRETKRTYKQENIIKQRTLVKHAHLQQRIQTSPMYCWFGLYPNTTVADFID